MQIVVAQMPLGNEDENGDEYEVEERCITLVLVPLLVLDNGIFAIASSQI